MRIVIGALGTYMVFAGMLLCLNPKIINRFVSLWSNTIRIRIAALITLLIGLLIIWAAKASNSQLFVKALGFMTIIKGIYLLFAPQSQLAKFMNWWTALPRLAHRLWGIAAASIGAFLLFKM